CQARGLDVMAIVMNDDVAVQDSLYTAGRRGVGATVLAEKICGAAAERGYDLARVEALCRRVNENGRSMGMALTSCTVPAAGKPTFSLGEGEMEMGVGIHGEPGRRRVPLAPAGIVAGDLCSAILHELEPKRGDPLLLMVNGFGGTPLLELYLMYDVAARRLQAEGLTIARSLVGNYVTSLEMAGCSLTVARLDEELLGFWDAPVHTAALRWGK